MLSTEYNEAEQMQLFKEDGRSEGLAEGQAEGRCNAADTRDSADSAIDRAISLVPDDFISDVLPPLALR